MALEGGVEPGTADYGEVTKIDSTQRRLMIRHGPIPDLGMNEGMTMVFRVADPTMINALKVGDPIRFRVDRVKGYLTVTEVEQR